MTLQTIPGVPHGWPGMAAQLSAAPATTTGVVLDAAGEYQAWVQCAQQDMVVSHVGLRLQAVAGSPTADIRIETVDPATGLPTGTLWAANTNLVTGALSAGWALHALTAAATITKGQRYAIKVVYNSGTSLTLNLMAQQAQRGLPYGVTNITGSAVKNSMQWAVFALGSSTTDFYPVPAFFPASSVAANAFNNTNSARRGVRFQVPFKCQVVGLRYYGGTAVGDFNAAMFDDAGNELSSSSTAFSGAESAANVASTLELIFDNPVTLQPGTWYRAAIEPALATNCNMYTATLPNANYRSACPGGLNFHYTTYTSGGGWVDSATDQVPFMDILIKQNDDGVGGGIAHVIGG